MSLAVTVRFRLTLYYAAALLLGAVVFSVTVYFAVRADLIRQMEHQLRRDLATLRRSIPDELDDVKEMEQRGGLGAFEVREGGRVIAASRGWDSVGTDYRVRTASVRANGRTFGIAVARDGRFINYTLHSLALKMTLSFGGLLALAAAGGYLLAGRVLAPIGSMASRARAITAERLSDRLPVANPSDELGRLATAFNSALARLEDSFDRLRRFTSDASHELRTPLTAIRTVGEVALRGEGDAEDCRDAIGSMLEEADRLTRLVESLLMLTRADSGAVALSREQVDLGVLASETAECMRVLAEEKSVELRVDSAKPLTVTADRATLRQALVNLLDNAIKYTPAGGHVRVTVSKAQDGRAAIAVSDDGPGIPAEHRDRIFDRFHRVEMARDRETGGAGLGLAIALWAAKANGGDIELESQVGEGATFRIVLPAGGR